MGQHERRPAGHHGLERCHSRASVAGVEVRGRLVEDEDRGVADDRAGDREAPPLAAAEAQAVVADPRRVAVGQRVDEGPRAGRSRAPTAPGRRSGRRRPARGCRGSSRRTGRRAGRRRRSAPGRRPRAARAARGRRPGSRRSRTPRTGGAAATRVDLPAPLGPTSASRPPAGIESDRPSMTVARAARVAEPEAVDLEPERTRRGRGRGRVDDRRVVASMSSNRRAPAASVASRRWTAAASGPTASNVAIAASGSAASSTARPSRRGRARSRARARRPRTGPVSSDDAPAATARIVVSRAVAPSIAAAAPSSRAVRSRRDPAPRGRRRPGRRRARRAVASARAAIRSRAGSRDADPDDRRAGQPRGDREREQDPARERTSIQPSSTHPNATAAAAAIGGTRDAGERLLQRRDVGRDPGQQVAARARTAAAAGASGSIEAKNHDRRSARTRNVPAWITIRSRYAGHGAPDRRGRGRR